jgi:hypothetical protein
MNYELLYLKYFNNINLNMLAETAETLDYIKLQLKAS